MKLDFEVMTITPTMASAMLDKHAHERNRTLRQRKIETYADDMKNKRWDLNGETIIIASDKTVLDGHHRLWACVMAETAFTTAVALNVDPDKFKSIDTGAPRTGADVIHSSGTHKHQRQIATACALLLRYKGGGLMHKVTPTPRDISDYFDNHPDVLTWVEASSKGDVRAFAPQVGAVMYAAGQGRWRPKCVEFVNGLVSGANLSKGSPILALRNRLLAKGERLDTFERFALVIMAWNAYDEGRSLQRMQMFKGDKFPKIRGAHS